MGSPARIQGRPNLHGMSPSAEIKLVVTGDDFGYCPRRDMGIVECFRAGGLSSVSLLVNGSSAASAADLARRFKIPIGLHANLSEGLPVCAELRQNSTLINTQGVFLGKMGIRKSLAQGLLNMSEVRQELQAQISLFRVLTGQNPQHMDGHQHVHILPGIREEFARVLQENDVRYTRLPVELGLHRCIWIREELMEFNRGVEKDALNSVEVFRSHAIRWPNLYIGLSTMGNKMSIFNIQRAIDYGIESLNSSLSEVQSMQSQPWQPGTSGIPSAFSPGPSPAEHPNDIAVQNASGLHNPQSLLSCLDTYLPRMKRRQPVSRAYDARMPKRHSRNAGIPENPGDGRCYGFCAGLPCTPAMENHPSLWDSLCFQNWLPEAKLQK